MMNIDPEQITAEAYHYSEAKNFYYVKVSIPDLDLYITSIKVSPSPRFPDTKLWVQPPAFNIYGKWIKPLEFPKGSVLWSIIEPLALEAVASYSSSETHIGKDILPTVEEVSKFNPETAFDDPF